MWSLDVICLAIVAKKQEVSAVLGFSRETSFRMGDYTERIKRITERLAQLLESGRRLIRKT